MNAASKAEALPRKLRNGVVSLLDRIDGASVLGAEINLKDRVTRESYDVLDEFIRRVTKSNMLLLILDELPILAKTLAENSSTNEALLLLRTLRALRSNHVATAILDGVAKSGAKGLTVDEVLTSLSVSFGRSFDRHLVLDLIHRLRLDHYIDFDDTIEPNVLRFCFNVVRDSWIARRAR